MLEYLPESMFRTVVDVMLDCICIDSLSVSRIAVDVRLDCIDSLSASSIVVDMRWDCGK